MSKDEDAIEPPLIDREPAPPQFHGTFMEHPWDKRELGGFCLRCGVLWPNRENCP